MDTPSPFTQHIRSSVVRFRIRKIFAKKKTNHKLKNLNSYEISFYNTNSNSEINKKKTNPSFFFSFFKKYSTKRKKSFKLKFFSANNKNKKPQTPRFFFSKLLLLSQHCVNLKTNNFISTATTKLIVVWCH